MKKRGRTDLFLILCGILIWFLTDAARIRAQAAEQGAGFISVYFGADVAEEEAQAAAEIFGRVCPEAEVAVLSGGQPVYYYIISFE